MAVLRTDQLRFGHVVKTEGPLSAGHPEVTRCMHGGTGVPRTVTGFAGHENPKYVVVFFSDGTRAIEQPSAIWATEEA